MASPSSSTLSAQWDEQRRRARQLESNIDARLSSLHKLAAQRNADGSPSPGSVVARRQQLDGTAVELDGLLERLAQINDDMSRTVGIAMSNGNGSGGAAAAAANNWASGAATQHTLRRHSEILRDYQSEVVRATSQLRQQLDREQLLGGTHSSQDFDDGHPHAVNNRARASDYYLSKEADHIAHSDRLLDQHIDMALHTKENLNRQRSTLGNVQRQLNVLKQKYPALGQLMTRIQARRRRDQIILGAVISACTILLLIYVL